MACSNNSRDDRGNAKSPGTETTTIDGISELPAADDDDEEVKATEPAIIGGAYLYCDSSEEVVGCRLANVAESDWVAANKTPDAINGADGSTNACPIVLPAPEDPYQVILEAERALQNYLKLQIEIALPQGQLRMTTTVNPASPKATAQRLSPGLALFASKGSGNDWPGVDQKTWNRWMKVKIPQIISSFTEADAAASETVELIFDDTVCSYKQQQSTTGPMEYSFDACSRSQWKANKIVHVKSLILRVTAGSAGVVLPTVF